MIQSKLFRASYKLLFGLLGFSALMTEIVVLIERGRFNSGNFFSFFTVQNNVLAFAVFLISALCVTAGYEPRWLDKLRSATTVYMSIVGIGFAVLLSGLENTVLTAVPWDNVVLHYIMPIAVIVDLLIDRPKTKLRFTQSLAWLLYPLAYLLYSLGRGNITGWYPYPFLNPGHKGYSGIAVVSAALLALGLGLIWIVCALSGRKHRLTRA